MISSYIKAQLCLEKQKMSRLRNYTLVIIDMQPYFSAAKNNRPLIAKIKQEIAKARRLNNHVMFVWYETCGKVTKSLRRAVAGYSNVSYVSKSEMDGGTEVLEALPAKTHLRCCGVNTDQCVYETVTTIAGQYPSQYRIELIAKGCASDGTFCTEEDALRMYSNHSNIRIDRAA
jgi:nicotinamidase-related amidase